MLQQPAHALYTPWQRRLFLAVLFVVATSNYVDRYIVAVLMEPIRREFGASDTQLGLLSGAAFALFYATFGLPAARWADRGNRRLIVAAALSLWSLMTALCGMAQTFWQLALARVGVGVGEAGSLPPGQSLLVDYFPAERRGLALAIYTSAGTAGYLIAFMGGAAIAAQHGWRWAFVAVGLPGLLVAVLAWAVLREPRDRLGYPPRTPGGAGLWQAARVLWRKRSYRLSLMALTVWAFFAYGAVLFVPSYVVRVLGVDLATVGAVYGGASALSSLVGTLAGGALSDTLGRRDRRWLLRLPALGVLLATPFYVAAFVSNGFMAFVLLGGIGAALVTAALPAVFAATHEVCGSARRATSVALLLFAMSLVGATLGPLVTGLLSDAFAARAGAESLRWSLLCTMVSMPLVALLLYRGSLTLLSDSEA